MKGVYLLHFEPRYKHAGHYIGFAEDILRRVYEHEMGKSDARLTTAASKAGCKLSLVRVWPKMGREFERSLKGRGRTGKAHNSAINHCPCCKRRNALAVADAVRLAYSDLSLAEDFGHVLATCLGLSDEHSVPLHSGCATDESGGGGESCRANEMSLGGPGHVSRQSELDDFAGCTSTIAPIGAARFNRTGYSARLREAITEFRRRTRV